MIQQPIVEETPTKPPGECFSCKATQLSPGRQWFLDTDVDYFDTPSYRIQICNICFDLLANTCGYIKIGEEVEQYKRAIAKLEERLDALRRYRRFTELLGVDDDRIDRILTLDENNLEPESSSPLTSSTEKRGGEGRDQKGMGRGKKGTSESPDDENVAKLRSVERSVTVNI